MYPLVAEAMRLCWTIEEMKRVPNHPQIDSCRAELDNLVGSMHQDALEEYGSIIRFWLNAQETLDAEPRA